MNHQVRLLFHELVELSPGEREQVFRDRQIGPELRAEVESLLGFDSTGHQRLTDRVADAAEDLLRFADNSELSYCGQYRLVRLLGSGGMGAVYLAERTDGEIQQQVAVKLLGAYDHRAVWRDRFLNERQLLASLNHPSIVHVIDAGHTKDGRPYLVMEYVDGTPIDVYAARIGVRDRLALFLRVCDGVSHAHHHLIIHRDLKPSNILVDASGQPKLLDFGIAKLLDETRDPTQTVDRLLTPNYASPEQLRGAPQTTATDVYSLGAVLYKLLTERSPHESDTHRSQALEVTAGTREISAPSRLNRDLPTDVDYILRKALRNEPEERYASVEAFASDVRALLESRPVEARSGNAWYRTRKFLRRFWVPVAASALTAIGLSAGLYVANRERSVAQQRFSQVRQFASRLIELESQIRFLPGATNARNRIVSTSLEYLSALGAEAHGDKDLALEIAAAYVQVAGIQMFNLGQFAQAQESLRRADALVQSVLSVAPENGTALLRSAEITHERMTLANSLNRHGDLLAYARETVARLDRWASEEMPSQRTFGKLAAIITMPRSYPKKRRSNKKRDIRSAIALAAREEGTA